MKELPAEKGFLAIPEPELCSFKNSTYVIQQVPYEYTSSYLKGSANGPAAIISASHFVEFYDEELDQETCREAGICTLDAMTLGNYRDKNAVDKIAEETTSLIQEGKFVISLGAEHTVTAGFVKAHSSCYKDICVLQIDAHSDLRTEYHGNPYSHASVMSRIHDMNIPLVQVGIRAQCREEAELIRSSPSIRTFYAHYIRSAADWMEEAVNALDENVYITIDADGFDPSVIPAVGTAEPNGLFWMETLSFLKKVFMKKNVIGFDIVECAPVEGSILSEYTLAKLLYRMIGYNEKFKSEK